MSFGNLKSLPLVAHFLQQGHVDSTKATPPILIIVSNSSTHWQLNIQTHEPMVTFLVTPPQSVKRSSSEAKHSPLSCIQAQSHREKFLSLYPRAPLNCQKNKSSTFLLHLKSLCWPSPNIVKSNELEMPMADLLAPLLFQDSSQKWVTDIFSQWQANI